MAPSVLLNLGYAGLGLVLVGVVLAAAWWTVQHAVASRTRIAILAWWVVLLAAALPAMDWASRGRKAPTIIIRKVTFQCADRSLGPLFPSRTKMWDGRQAGLRLSSCSIRQAYDAQEGGSQAHHELLSWARSGVFLRLAVRRKMQAKA